MSLDPDEMEEWRKAMGTVKPIFDMPLLTREQLSRLQHQEVDRKPGERAAWKYLNSRPTKLSPLIPLALIGLMLGVAALVWGKI